MQATVQIWKQKQTKIFQMKIKLSWIDIALSTSWLFQSEFTAAYFTQKTIDDANLFVSSRKLFARQNFLSCWSIRWTALNGLYQSIFNLQAGLYLWALPTAPPSAPPAPFGFEYNRTPLELEYIAEKKTYLFINLISRFIYF